MTKISEADERRARILRLMAAAYDSPGVRIIDGNTSVRVSRRAINPAFAARLAEEEKP